MRWGAKGVVLCLIAAVMVAAPVAQAFGPWPTTDTTAKIYENSGASEVLRQRHVEALKPAYDTPAGELYLDHAEEPAYDLRIKVMDQVENTSFASSDHPWGDGVEWKPMVAAQAPDREHGSVAITDGTSDAWIPPVPSETGHYEGAREARPIPPATQEQFTLHGDDDLRWAEPAGSDGAQPLTRVTVQVAVGLLLAALFSRLHADRMTDHPVRGQILSLVEGDPGIRIHEVAERLEVRQSLIAYHVQMMTDHGVLKLERVGSAAHLFPPETTPTTRQQAVAAKHPTAAKIFAAIQQEPGARLKDIQAATGTSPSLVHHHLRKLMAAGVVYAVRNGRNHYYAQRA